MVLSSEFEYFIQYPQELKLLSDRGIILVNDSGIFDIRGEKCQHIKLDELHNLVLDFSGGD